MLEFYKRNQCSYLASTFHLKRKTKGGHLLDSDLFRGKLKMDIISVFNLKLSNTSSFSNLDLAKDLSSDIEKVESKK